MTPQPAREPLRQRKPKEKQKERIVKDCDGEFIKSNNCHQMGQIGEQPLCMRHPAYLARAWEKVASSQISQQSSKINGNSRECMLLLVDISIFCRSTKLVPLLGNLQVTDSYRVSMSICLDI